MAQSVQFFQPGTEGAIDYGQIQRQRALAEMLQKQGMTPQQGQMVSGHYVAPSPLSYVAQLAQVLAGKHKENQADEREQTLIRTMQAQRSKEAQDFMTASNGTPAVPGRSIAPLTPNDDEGNAMPSADVAGQAAVAPDRNRALAIALQSQNPALQTMGGKMMERQMDAEELKAALASAGIGAPAGGAPAASGEAPGASAPGGGIPGIDPRAMALMLSRLPQAQKLGGMIQDVNKPMALAEGGTAYSPTGGPMYTAPKTEAGVNLTRDPRTGQALGATPVSGYGETKAAIAGPVAAAEAQARQRAESAETLVQVPTAQGTQTMTREQATQYLRGQSGGGAPAPARPGATGPGYAGGSAAAAAGGQSEILAAELGKAQQELAAAQQRGDAAGASRAQSDMAGIQREMGRLPGAGRGMQGGAPAPVSTGLPGISGPSPAQTAAQDAERARGVKTAEADVGRDTTRQADVKTAQKFLNITARVKDVFNDKPTDSTVGSLYDSANAVVGRSTPGAEAAQRLKALGGWMVANVPRMEGPQSNFDVANYQIMAADVANDKLPLARRRAALDSIEKMMQDVASGEAAKAPAPKGGGFKILGVQ